MLFLLNDTVIEIDAPEAHLMQRWRTIGCGDPRQLRAQQAIEVAIAQFEGLSGASPEDQLRSKIDIAALVIAKTGANSLILKPNAAGGYEPRLRDVPPVVLEAYQHGAANDRGERRRA
ncbi:MAG: hypothetical protein AAGL97_16060 [Pseudomonadota bacterium]